MNLVYAAIVTGVFGLVIEFIRRNSKEHGRTHDLLQSIDTRLTGVQGDVGGIKNWIEQHDARYPVTVKEHP